MNRPKLVYICGMGHNGSTILNMALNMSPQVLGVSQLNDLLNPYDPHKIAEENRTEIDQFWINTLGQFSQSEIELLRRAHESVNQERNLLTMFFSKKKRAEFAKINSRLVIAVLEMAGKNVLVDSSKNITRALGLTQCADVDVYYIHLIRDVRGLVNSHNKRLAEKSRPRRYVRSSLHWFAKNLSASLLLPFCTGNRIKIQYEDIVKAPDKVMDRLESFLDESLSETRAALCGQVDIDSQTLGFGGNRVLRKKTAGFELAYCRMMAFFSRTFIGIRLAGFQRFGDIADKGISPIRGNRR